MQYILGRLHTAVSLIAVNTLQLLGMVHTGGSGGYVLADRMPTTAWYNNITNPAQPRI